VNAEKRLAKERIIKKIIKGEKLLKKQELHLKDIVSALKAEIKLTKASIEKCKEALITFDIVPNMFNEVE